MSVRSIHSINRSLRSSVLMLAFILLMGMTAFADGNIIIIPSGSKASPGDYPGYNVQSNFVPKTNNEDEPPVFHGGEIRFLANQSTAAQELCGVFRSSDGKIIVIDGGQEADTEHLYRTIVEMGGYVDAWLITHPQTDHVGGLYAMLRDHRNDIDIRGIYGHMFEFDWYKSVDPDEIGMVWVLNEQLATFDQSRLHLDLHRNDYIGLSDRISIRVMNDARKSTGPYAVNSSGLMYDVYMDGKHIILLGDMGETIGDEHLNEGVLLGVECDYVQMSHHGQDGVGQNFYQVLAPKNCIFCAPSWLYEPQGGRYKTEETKRWLRGISSVEAIYCTMNGDVIIR